MQEFPRDSNDKDIEVILHGGINKRSFCHMMQFVACNIAEAENNPTAIQVSSACTNWSINDQSALLQNYPQYKNMFPNVLPSLSVNSTRYQSFKTWAKAAWITKQSFLHLVFRTAGIVHNMLQRVSVPLVRLVWSSLCCKNHLNNYTILNISSNYTCKSSKP